MDKTKSYIESIKTKYPNMVIHDVSLNQDGQNNDILIMNKEFIFRFPKYPKGIVELKKETTFLTKVQKQLSLAIPNPTFINFDADRLGQVFTGYRMIPGQPLMRDLFDLINEKEDLAAELANFLRELHSIEIDETLQFMNSTPNYYEKWDSLLIRMKEKLFPYMRKDACLLVEESFGNYLSNKENFSFKPTVIHGDFGPTNILYNKEAKKIGGVIDFGNVTIGDPANDFASLMGPFGYSESFLKLFSQTYSGVEVYLERARFYSITFALQEALFGIENNDMESFNSGLEMYREN